MNKRIITLDSRSKPRINCLQILKSRISYKRVGYKIIEISVIVLATVAVISLGTDKKVEAEPLKTDAPVFSTKEDKPMPEELTVANGNYVKHNILNILMPEETIQVEPTKKTPSGINVLDFVLNLDESFTGDTTTNLYKNSIVSIQVSTTDISESHYMSYVENILGINTKSTTIDVQVLGEKIDDLQIATEVRTLQTFEKTIYHLKAVYKDSVLSVVTEDTDVLKNISTLIDIQRSDTMIDAYIINTNIISDSKDIFGLTIPVFKSGMSYNDKGIVSEIKCEQTLETATIVSGVITQDTSLKDVLSTQYCKNGETIVDFVSYQVNWTRLPATYYEMRIGSQQIQAYTLFNPIAKEYVFFSTYDDSSKYVDAVKFLNVIAKNTTIWE